MRWLIPHVIYGYQRDGQTSGQFQAATLFADISGFTALTEALMQYQKDGAEVLTTALNEVFQPLVAALYAHNGFITTFAGDAFTALFPIQHDPAEAASNAVAVAFHTQRLFQERYHTLQTKYGDFSLSVKVGIGTGLVEWGILRGHQPPAAEVTPHTFFFRGTAIDACAQAEHYAERGEIIATVQVAALLAGQVVVETRSAAYGSLIALADPAPPLSAAALPDLSSDIVQPFVPDAVIELSDSGVAAEFRQVATVFISFAEPSGREELRTFVTIVLDLTLDYGGYFNKLDFGDKGGVMLIVFGAPVAHENDVVRAADFLLALAEHEVGIAWRAGLTFDTVYAGFIGGHERSEYTVIGDAVNLAARLMMRAEWGHIWLSPLANQRLRGRNYHTDALGTFTFKGKSNAIAVARLVGKNADMDGTPAGLSYSYSGQIIGRDDELAHLIEWIGPLLDAPALGGESAQTSPSRLIAIYGEPGMGKSRLVYELRWHISSARRLRWLLCTADEIMRQSLSPFKSMLRSCFNQSPHCSLQENKQRFDQAVDILIASVPPSYQVVARELQRTRSFLGALIDLHWANSLYEQLEPRLRFENMLVAFRAFLLAESLRQPVVLQIDDMQWLDADSQELIRSTTRALDDLPLVILCVSRYHDDGSHVPLPVDAALSPRIMDLTALSVEQVRLLTARLLDGGVSDTLTEFLVEKTRGNPFFVEQLALDLRERHAIAPGEAGWQLETGSDIDVPTNINAVLMARLDRLSAQVRQVVQTASVLGHEFALQVLTAMLRGNVHTPRYVQAAEEERIWSVISELRYLFRHPLLRDAAYSMQLRTRLRELHTLAGQAIEQVYADHLAPYYADLAYHYGQADDLEHERSYARLAGIWAASRFANSEAIQHLSRALELTPAAARTERYDLLCAREQVYDLQGDRQSQSSDLDELASLANLLDDNQQRAYVVLRWSNCADRIGDYPAMSAAAQGAIFLGQTMQRLDIEASGYLQWARALWYQGENDAARSQAEQSLKLARAVQSRQIEADSLRILGNVALYQGNYAEARTAFEQSLQLCRELTDWYGESGALNNLGIITFYQGDYALARSYYEESLRLNREAGDRQGESMALGNLGEVAAAQGDYAAAQAAFEQSLELYWETGDQYGESLTLFNLGEVAATLGDYDTARARFEQSLDICRAIGHRQHESWVLSKMALLLHRLGENRAAHDLSKQALALSRDVQDRNVQSYALTHLGHTLVEFAHLDAAADAYQEAYEIRQTLEQPHQAMEPLSGLARVALAQNDLSRASDYVQGILHHLETETLDGTDEPFRIYLTCYRVLQTSGSPQAAATLAKARQLLEERAALIQDERLQYSYLQHVTVHRELREQSDIPFKES